jgi:hypothetical protein
MLSYQQVTDKEKKDYIDICVYRHIIIMRIIIVITRITIKQIFRIGRTVYRVRYGFYG